MANWYGIYTRPRWEKKVSDALHKRKIESYCPLRKTTGGWGDKRKAIFEPLFTSFVFVRINALQIEEVKKLDGVINMVYWLGKPAVFRDIEIEMTKRFLNEHQMVRLQKTAVNTHEIVKIVSENHADLYDASDVMTQAKSIKLILPTLGYTIVADVEHASAPVMVPNKVRNYDMSLLKIG